MKTFLFNVLVLTCLAYISQNVAAQTETYEDDIYFFLNEVENHAKDARQAVGQLIDEDDIEIPQELEDKKEEIETKATGIVDDLNSAVQQLNQTGLVIGEVSDCFSNLQKSTEDEVNEYIDILDHKCFTDFNNKTLMDIYVNLTQNEAQGEELYEDFLFGVVNCAHTVDYLTCQSDVEDNIRKRGQDILDSTDELTNLALAESRGYIIGIELCTKLVYEKIDYVEINVRNGVRDCTPTDIP